MLHIYKNCRLFFDEFLNQVVNVFICCSPDDDFCQNRLFFGQKGLIEVIYIFEIDRVSNK